MLILRVGGLVTLVLASVTVLLLRTLQSMPITWIMHTMTARLIWCCVVEPA